MLTDISELTRREREQIEWKENVADIDDVVATLCAFANDLQNLGGGYVVCGAREEKDEHGFPTLVRTGLTASRLKEVEGTVLARCRERVFPPILPVVDELAIEGVPERRILAFTQASTQHAHTFRRADGTTKHYVQLSRSTIEARNGVLRELLVRKGDLEPWDRRPCADATENDLDLIALRDALQRMGVFSAKRGLEPFLSSEESLSPFIPPLFAKDPLTGVLRPRNYAMALFGRNPQRFIPGAVSLFSIYPGTNRASQHSARHELAGTLLEQARQIQSLLDAQAPVLFDKSDLVTPNANKYPKCALYEAMGNTLAHRDYQQVDPTRIVAFSDRIEFHSPGPLLSRLPLEAMRSGEAAPQWRNQALAWFFQRLNLAQAEGQGISTILQAMKQEGCPPPRFEADIGRVLCVLPAHPRHAAPAAQVEAARAAEAAPKSPSEQKWQAGSAEDFEIFQLISKSRDRADARPLAAWIRQHPQQATDLPSSYRLLMAQSLLQAQAEGDYEALVQHLFRQPR